MAKMKIQISKDDFEQSILAATSSHSEVFESVEKHFEESYLRLSRQILGEVGEEALETSDELREAVIKTVCLDAFLSVVRHLDLVLAPTGFGVVANNEVSPASSSRVEALIEQCRVALIVAQDRVMSHLTVVSGWGSTLQAKQGIQTVLWSMEGYCYLTRQTSMTSKDWMAKLAAIQEADATLRKLVSDEQMDDIMCLVRGVREGNEFEGSVRLMLSRCLIMLANDMLSAYSNERARLLRYFDANLDKFPLYANSSAYKANHFKEFQNEKSKPAFVFNS
jgi:hypothetical protein